MIISHQHRYLFVELRRTASTAISAELQANYDGVPVLHKHSPYHHFLRIASAEERNYFVFSCIRNPLDEAVSIFHKQRENPDRSHVHMAQRRKDLKVRARVYYALYARGRFDILENADADFTSFFLKLYRRPYDNWSSLSHRDFDFVIRHEKLQQGFAKVLGLLGIDQIRPVPWVNRTSGKDGDYLSYYTPETIGRAKWVMGPFMKEWGYKFPAEWGAGPIPWSSLLAFRALKPYRHLMWKCLATPLA